MGLATASVSLHENIDRALETFERIDEWSYQAQEACRPSLSSLGLSDHVQTCLCIRRSVEISSLRGGERSYIALHSYVPRLGLLLVG